jgi:hypothetical protein
MDKVVQKLVAVNDRLISEETSHRGVGREVAMFREVSYAIG